MVQYEFRSTILTAFPVAAIRPVWNFKKIFALLQHIELIHFRLRIKMKVAVGQTLVVDIRPVQLLPEIFPSTAILNVYRSGRFEAIDLHADPDGNGSSS